MEKFCRKSCTNASLGLAIFPTEISVHKIASALHRATKSLNNVVITTVIEMVEILGARFGKRSVERVRYRYVINNITLGHCEIWSHFTLTLYFHSPSARDNTDATREISRRIICLIGANTLTLIGLSEINP